MLTQEYLNEILEYRDGRLYWKVNRCKAKVGFVAGRTKTNGYCEVRVDKKLHGTHRLIFMMHYGYMPKYVDHIDGNPSNNLLENLRPASHLQNMWNSKTPKTNTSGFKGVYWDNKFNKWRGQCFVNNKHYTTRFFDDVNDAAKAVEELRNKHHGEFARHN